MIPPITSTALRGTIYTVGYGHPDAAAQLDRLMRDPRTRLIDIRLQPQSRWWPEWNRAALSARYGRRYVWDRRLGNLHYQHREQAIQLAEGHPDAIGEAATLICEGISLILLCACRNARECHRSLVAKLIQDSLPVPQHGEVRV
ncbi:MAG TPA: DUF488 family protein [Ktedonobacteraceae bacterium]